MKTIQKGFTLIELMIVIAIVGILAAIALPAYQNYTASAKFSEVIASVAPIKTAIEICVQKKGPSDMTTCDQEAEFGAVLASASASGDYGGSVVVATSGTNGEITATSATINGTTKNYILTPTLNTTYATVDWDVSASSTCIAAGWC